MIKRFKPTYNLKNFERPTSDKIKDRENQFVSANPCIELSSKKSGLTEYLVRKLANYKKIRSFKTGNKLLIDFDSLIKNESDDTVKNMHRYFESQEPTKQNEYTGIFAGKNLIFITAEGFSYLAVDEKYTPTLYKMANSGLVFDNYYQPIWSCSTSDGEFSNMLSIIPNELLITLPHINIMLGIDQENN